MSRELAKTYDPKGLEDRLYKKWEKNGYFHSEPDPDKEPFTIVMPPPNITGQLHMGHALDNTLQDILIRYKRMQGYAALWLPGTDHASIATEAKVVEKRKEQGIKKEDIGREKFLEEGIRRPHCRTAAEDGVFRGLGARTLYHGRRLQPRGKGSLRQVIS